jgi:hypothetical protein
VLHLKASKTGKKADFDLSLSEVLPALLERRRGYQANHLMLISTPDGFPGVPEGPAPRVGQGAREGGGQGMWRAAGDEQFAVQIEAMWLRDMRKMAADQAVDAEAASKLLQHSSVALTKRHYRTLKIRHALKPREVGRKAGTAGPRAVDDRAAQSAHA